MLGVVDKTVLLPDEDDVATKVIMVVGVTIGVTEEEVCHIRPWTKRAPVLEFDKYIYHSETAPGATVLLLCNSSRAFSEPCHPRFR